MRALLTIALALWAAASAPPAAAEEIVLGLSQDSVAITATFDGSEILIFGAVRREAPAPKGAPLEVVVAVTGPLEPITVRRKARTWGIWANRDAVAIDAAPSFYAVASSGPLAETLSETENLRHGITVDRAIRSVGNPVAGAQVFTEALIRIRRSEGLYQRLEGAVDVEEETLFRTALDLPSNLRDGDYTARIFLTRAGQVVDHYETPIAVEKVGLERWLYNLAHNLPLVYGLMSLAIAIFAGWAASAAFQLVRR